MDEKREHSDNYASDDSWEIGDKRHLIREELDEREPHQPKRDGDDEGKEKRSLEPIIILLRNIASLRTERCKVDRAGMI